MRRGTIVVILFILVVAAIIGTSQFLRSQPPVELRIAVSPLAVDWARRAIDGYNATEPIINTQRLRFIVESVEDTSVWLDDGLARREWTPDNHPAAWIPAWSTSVRYASERMPFELVTPSLARTGLVWGGFQSRVNALTANGTAFDWERIAGAASQGNWSGINPDAGLSSNLTLAFNRPNQTISGLAVLLSGAAAHAGTVDLTVDDLTNTDFRAWMQPVLGSVPNFTTLGASPAQTIAVRGASAGEIALLPESEWLRNLRGSLINTDDPIVLSYPALPFLFDFPLAVWQDNTPITPQPLSPSELRAAINGLSAWLSAPQQQAALSDFGLRPAQAEADLLEAPPLFTAGGSYGAQISPDFSIFVQAPNRNDIQRLLAWANPYIR